MTSCLLANLFPPVKAQAADWETLPPLPEPNGGFACGVDHGCILVAGGTNWVNGEKHWLSRVHSFDPKSKTWATLFDLETPVGYAVTGISKRGSDSGEAFVFAGGSTGKGGSTGQFWLEGHGHRMVKAGLPADQAAVVAAGGMLGHRLIISGGSNDAANIAGLKRATVSLAADGTIEKLPDHPGKPFGTAASAVVGDQLFIFGGGTWTGVDQLAVNLDQAYAFSVATKSWRKLQNLPVATRGITAAPLSDRVIYLAGGFVENPQGFTADAFLYDIAKNTYIPAKALPHKAMVALVACEGYIYCLGGEDKQKSRTDACFRIPIEDLFK